MSSIVALAVRVGSGVDETAGLGVIVLVGVADGNWVGDAVTVSALLSWVGDTIKAVEVIGGIAALT